MKKILFKIGTICLLMLGSMSFDNTRSMHATAATQIKIDKKTFPGKNFRQSIKRFDKNKNGYLSKKEIKAVKSLTLDSDLIHGTEEFNDKISYSDAPIINVKGMEYFTSVREISILGYRLKNFSPGKMKKLQKLKITYSSVNLKILDLRKNKNLSELAIGHSNITEIKFASSSKLRRLEIRWEEKLKKPDFASLKRLKTIEMEGMPYKKLDFRKCKNLTNITLLHSSLQKISFGKANKKVEQLDLSKYTDVSVTGKLLSTDFLSELPNLKSLNLSNNSLDSLDVTKNSMLKELYCDDNNLSTLDVTKNSMLETLFCDDNKLSTLDVSKNSMLKILYCAGNKLSTLDVTKNGMLKELWCIQNKLSTLDVTKNSMLEKLYCSENNISILDLTQNYHLKILSCEKTNLSTLDLMNNRMLERLYCSKDLLINLDPWIVAKVEILVI